MRAPLDQQGTKYSRNSSAAKDNLCAMISAARARNVWPNHGPRTSSPRAPHPPVVAVASAAMHR
jgi:hypothetical protein